MPKNKSKIQRFKFTESIGLENLGGISTDSILLTEAKDSNGYKYRVIVVKSGLTTIANSKFKYGGTEVMAFKDYPVDTLKRVVADQLLEGIPVLARGIEKHMQADNSGIDTMVGSLNNSTYNETENRIEADLNVKRGKGLAGVMRTALKQLFDTGQQIGLSIAAFGKATILAEAGRYIARADEINEFQSVDIVPEGNAGGAIIKLVEAFSNNPNGEKRMNPKLKAKLFFLLQKAGKIKSDAKVEDFTDEKIAELGEGLDIPEPAKVNELTPEQRTAMFTALKKANLVKDTDKVEDFKDEKLFEMFTKAEFKTPEPTPPATPPADDPVAKANEILKKAQEANEKTEKLGEELIAKENQAEAKVVLAESKLPNMFKDKLKKQYKDFGVIRTKEDVDNFKEVLKLEQDALVEANPNFKNMFSDGETRIQLLGAERDKLSAAVDLLICPKHKQKAFIEANPDRKDLYKAVGDQRTSLKEMYGKLTGDIYVTGRADLAKLTEGLTTASWAEIFGDSMRRNMMVEYNMQNNWDDWRKIASIGETPDFRAKKYIEMGGYDDLLTVAEDAEFQETDSPTDHEVENTAETYGYIERITRRMILNDDLNAVQRIPTKMGQAAKRTLYKKVFNPIILNSLIYDTKALLHADHANLLTDLLGGDGVAFTTAMQKLKDQTEKDNGEKMGLVGKYLIIPSTVGMRTNAYKLTVPAFGVNNTVPNFHQTFQVEPIEVIHWTSTTDWRIMADPNQNPTVQVDFLQGKQDPEMFISDMIASDTFFVRERIRYKLRHEYGIAVLSYKTVSGSVVANP